MAIPLVSEHGLFFITLRSDNVTDARAEASEIALVEIPGNDPEERYHLSWYDLNTRRFEVHAAASYTYSPIDRVLIATNILNMRFIIREHLKPRAG